MVKYYKYCQKMILIFFADDSSVLVTKETQDNIAYMYVQICLWHRYSFYWYWGFTSQKVYREEGSLRASCLLPVHHVLCNLFIISITTWKLCMMCTLCFVQAMASVCEDKLRQQIQQQLRRSHSLDGLTQIHRGTASKAILSWSRMLVGLAACLWGYCAHNCCCLNYVIYSVMIWEKENEGSNKLFFYVLGYLLVNG